MHAELCKSSLTCGSILFCGYVCFLLKYFHFACMCPPVLPEQLDVFLGKEANISCSVKATFPAFSFIINSADYWTLDINPVIQQEGEIFTFSIALPGSPKYNNATIQCIVIFKNDTSSVLRTLILNIKGEQQLHFCLLYD